MQMSRYFIAASLLLSGCSELARQEFPQPNRIHYSIAQYRWRKGPGDYSAERWSHVTEAIAGQGFPSLQQDAYAGKVFGTGMDFDWRIGEKQDNTYFNLRFTYTEREKTDKIRSPLASANVKKWGYQKSIELGLTKELEIESLDNLLVFGTARLGYFDQDTGGRGSGFIGFIPVYHEEDHSDDGLYGGLEIGLRIPMSKSLKDLGWSINYADPDNVFFTTSIMTNYEQTAFFIGFTFTDGN
ncbi:MAG: hypothetical protein ABIA37_04715 [Candidatus Woesearchaeota archaeon]